MKMPRPIEIVQRLAVLKGMAAEYARHGSAGV